MKAKMILAKVGGIVATAALVAGVAKLGYMLSPEEMKVVEVFFQSLLLGL